MLMGGLEKQCREPGARLDEADLRQSRFRYQFRPDSLHNCPISSVTLYEDRRFNFLSSVRYLTDHPVVLWYCATSTNTAREEFGFGLRTPTRGDIK